MRGIGLRIVFYRSYCVLLFFLYFFFLFAFEKTEHSVVCIRVGS